MSSHSDHLLLVGMMGSGKTTVGERLAARLGRMFLDSDWQIEAATGKTVAQIFETEGEAAFRAKEREALQEAASARSPLVIAVAGGAVLEPANREVIASAGRVVWLNAQPETLIARLGDGKGRPLLETDPEGAIRRLDAERRPVYTALADVIIDIDAHSTPDAVVDEIVHQLRETVTVDLGDRTYDVLIGPGTKDLVSELIPKTARKAAIVTQQSIGIGIECPLPATTFFLPEGEAAKSLTTIEELCSGFALMGLTRNDVVIGIGGGVVTDVAGFAAACYHRGTPVVHVATTLLAQIDAAIGGKTGVNLPEGKNLVGAFYQPTGVICDTDTLATLPDREWRSGLGEMAKYAFLGVNDLDQLPLVAQVAQCVACKADVVASDEREGGRRAILNYGHTLAHALEAAGFADNDDIDLRHGEAVAIGVGYAARLARRLGRIDDARVERHLEVLGSYGLSTAMPEGVDLESLIPFMARDKKVTSGLAFVLDGPDGVELVNNVDPAVVLDALRETAAS